jgi:hypothetical protein
MRILLLSPETTQSLDADNARSIGPFDLSGEELPEGSIVVSSADPTVLIMRRIAHGSGSRSS